MNSQLLFERLNDMSKEDLLRFSHGMLALSCLCGIDNVWLRALEIKQGHHPEPAPEFKEAIDFTVGLLYEDIELEFKRSSERN